MTIMDRPGGDLRTLARSADLPTAPMGTAAIAILLLVITGTGWLVYRRKA